MSFLTARRSAPRPCSFYFADYLEKNFPETGQSSLLKQIKAASSLEEIKGLEADVSLMIDMICSQGPNNTHLYNIQNFYRQVGYRTPDSLDRALKAAEVREFIDAHKRNP